ncbi:hypothetical protein [Bacillus sp. 005/A4HT-01/001]|uniref:hypothetical protein n=1 Tax=Bacillus sp. 005/A4HT-01/001 TaxID=2509010 RepID=UPI0010753623|nr:hypothetical protein [Bacillus sp. 005/A4HT-01/001]TFW48026.1 hypothetical protein ES896_06795 [Bacillus sp. 005/A4HT-01/001]
MDIQKLEDQINEVIEKDEELQDLRLKQIEILRTKAKEFEEVIDLYKSKEIRFCHPNNNVKTIIGPIMGVKDRKIYIYHRDEKRVISMYADSSVDDSERSNWSELIFEGLFEDALIGFNYLLNMQADYLDFYNKEIDKINHLIEQYK